MSLLDVMEEARRWLLLYPSYLHLLASKIGPGGEIVEVAVVDAGGNTLVDELVRPRGVIRPQLSQVHGITNERVRAAPVWAEVWPRVKKALGERPVIVYDAEKILQLMRQSHRIGCLRWDVDEQNLVSARELFARFHQESDPRRGARHVFTLDEAASLLGLSSEPVLYRRALDDARLVRLLLLRMADPAGRQIG